MTSALASTKFLQFPLGENGRALLELATIREIIAIARADILPVPDVAAALLGVMSWRGELLWLLDIEQLLGGVALPTAQAHTLVTTVQGKSLGIVVRAVGDIATVAPAQLQAPQANVFPAQWLEFIQAYLADGSIVLNLGAIGRSATWRH